jgi:hypothetical protein
MGLYIHQSVWKTLTYPENRHFQSVTAFQAFCCHLTKHGARVSRAAIEISFDRTWQDRTFVSGTVIEKPVDRTRVMAYSYEEQL